MISMLETSRAEYKAAYDQLIQFEQDNCGIQVPSVPWPLPSHYLYKRTYYMSVDMHLYLFS